jgi:hypothetical protein
MNDIKAQFQKNKKDFVGETYRYSNNILAPRSIGMSDKGDLSVLANDIAGLLSYSQLLVEGGGYASKSGKPMGNSYFLKTMGQCVPTDLKGRPVKVNDKEIVNKDEINLSLSNKKRKDKVRRYIYINNIPQGELKGLDGDFSDFRGLIPGIVNNITAMDPTEILGGLMEGLDPSCAKIRMNVVDNNNRVTKESRHVALSDIKNLNPCLFGGNGARNPLSGKRCSQAGFANMFSKGTVNKIPKKEKKSGFVNVYNLSMSLFFMYLLYKILKKN